MKPEELEIMPRRIEELFFEQQNRVMEDVIRRIRKTGVLTSTADYQIERMIDMGQTTEWIESEIKRLGKLTNAEIWELYDEALEKEYVRNKAIYEQINANFIPLSENEEMQQWVRAIVKQTQGEISNITQSLGFTVSIGGGKKVFTPLAKYYQKYLDRACLDIVTGVFDYNTVLRRVAAEMSASGLQTVTYASGHSDRATVAARRAVMTGVNQLSSKINLSTADKLGADYFEVAWHSGARPTHWWGGMVFSRKDLEDVCGYGRVDGLCGANCRHNFQAFFPGISVPLYTESELAKMNAKEKETLTYAGKEYNAYEATQRQRELERRMQRQRANITNLKKGGGSADDIMAAQSKYLSTLSQYKDFSKKMGLQPQMERVYVDRLGRVVNGRPKTAKTVEKNFKNGIIKTDKQFGKKIGKHSADYGLDPSNPKDRIKMEEIIDDILSNPDEKRLGDWRSQPGDSEFYIKGNDVVVVNGNKFVTILKGGIENARVKNARKPGV